MNKMKIIALIMALTSIISTVSCGGKRNQNGYSEKELDSSKKPALITTAEEKLGIDKEIVKLNPNGNWKSEKDGLLLTLNENNSFKYYRSFEDLTNNYYEGNYKFYMGEEAKAYITEELSSYNVTDEELEKIFEMNEKFDVSNFVCLILSNEKCMIDGANVLKEKNEAPYMGFYFEEEKYLDITNMNSVEKYIFEFEE